MSFSFTEVPIENRCYQSRCTERYRIWPAGDCFFGVPEYELYGRKPLSKIPQGAAGFHFYLGSDQRALLDSYLGSNLPQITKSLHIGNSSYGLGVGRDYSQLTESLLQCPFPKLRTLELGVWQLFCNSHCAYGDVGKIDGLATKMPELQKLFVYGKCRLSTPLSIPKLEILHVVVDDWATGINGGPLAVETVSNILSSSLPRLRELYVDLAIDEEHQPYVIPESILTENVFPRLTKFELVGNFRFGEKQRLLKSPFLYNRNARISLDEMVELEQ